MDGIGRNQHRWPYRNLHTLSSHVVLYTAAIRDAFILMLDKGKPHTARLEENMLEKEAIKRMVWTACSPDLNLVEHIWNTLRRRIAGSQCLH